MNPDTSNCLTAALAEHRVLLLDGATGTNLFERGLQTGDAPELWNAEHPDRIAAHYRSFIDAGSDIILTNSFGGNRFRLALHSAESRVDELNQAAARLAREQVADSGRKVLVAGSMGPTGEILEPNGALSIDEAATAFAEQAAALQAGGADLLWLETLSSSEEVVAAVTGAGATDLPVVVTISIDTNGRTMMGLTASDLVNLAPTLTHPIAAIGTNCGTGASEVVVAIANFRQAAESAGQSPTIVAKANCGIPEYVDGKIVYNGTPELMAEYATLAIDSGATLIGGCCGTTPAHIRSMRQAIDAHADTPAPAPTLARIVDTLGEVSKGAAAQFNGDLSLAAGSASGRSERRSRRNRRGSKN